VLIVSAAAVVRLIFAAIIPLFPDETYYWEWSRRLAPGYFDHPGGIAWLVRAGGALLAPFGGAGSPVGVRLGAIVAGWIATLATVATARRIGGDSAALRAAFVITVRPLGGAGLFLATPDAPVLAATAVGLYCIVRAFDSPIGSHASLRWWCLAGLALGAAFASKYTSIFLPVGVVAAVVFRRELRPRLAEPGPWAACAIATLVFLPVLMWNAQHEWISFLFQIKHGLARPEGSALRAAWRHEGDFWGGQAGLASPILFVMLGLATWRGFRTRDARFVLAMVAAVSFGFFVYSALRQRVEPNWPAPAYIPAVVLLAVTEWKERGRKWLAGGVVLAAVLSAVIYAQGFAPILPIAPRKDPIGRAFGWRDVADSADAAAEAASRETASPSWLGGDRYQEASELAFQIAGNPTAFAVNLSGRQNQYDLWPGFRDLAHRGDNLVLVVDDSPEGTPHDAVKALMPHFTQSRRGALVALTRGAGVIGTRRVWTLLGWRGTWPTAR
jgi:4-amino-4-deoxy-L-arabinose transferase-like glycosyltransferase